MDNNSKTKKIYPQKYIIFQKHMHGNWRCCDSSIKCRLVYLLPNKQYDGIFNTWIDMCCSLGQNKFQLYRRLHQAMIRA